MAEDFISGALAGQQYAQSKAMFGLTVESAQQKITEGTLNIQEKEIAVKNARLLMTQQETMNRLMSNLDSSGKPSATDAAANTADLMMKVSDAAFRSGRFEEGAKYAKEASEITENNSKIAARTANQQAKMYKDVTDILGSAEESAKGWDQAKQLFATSHPDEMQNPNIQKILEMPYSPGLVKRIAAGVATAKERSEIEKNHASAVDSFAKARESDVRTKDLIPAQARAAKARATALEGAGAGALVAKPTDINEMVKLAKQDYPNADPEELYNLSRSVAEAAVEYQKVDKMDRHAAQDKAYAEARQGRHYAGMAERGKAKIGTVATNPLPLPKTEKDLKLNMFYVTKSTKLPGGIGVWNGTGFDPPEAPESTADSGDSEESRVENPE